MSTDDGAGGPPSAYRLGYLLKLAALRLAELTGEALAPHRIDPRELAVLTVLADQEPLSQQEAARLLGIDRTTMVALIDRLEGAELVHRRPDPDDRRKNQVELTAHGRRTRDAATEAVGAAERRFMAAFPDHDTEWFRRALWAVSEGFRH